MSQAPKNIRRRWFQFSITLMLLLVTQVAVLLAWRIALDEPRRIETNSTRADWVRTLEFLEGQRSAVHGPELENQIAKAREAIEKLDHQ
jgi:hypothetical protein